MIISVAQTQIFLMALSRVMALMIPVPVLGGQNIPAQVRVGFGLMLTIVLIPWQPLSADAQALSLFAFSIGIGKEIIIGTLAGFAAMLTFNALQITGEAIGLESGFSSGRIFNPAMGEGGSAYNQLFIMVALLYFVIIDGHHLFIIAMQKTFEVIPINGALPFGSLEAILRSTADLITAGIQMALPVMAALFMTDLTLGLLARVSPQVQVYFLGLPVKVGISMVALGLLFTIILPSLSQLYQEIAPRMILFLEK